MLNGISSELFSALTGRSREFSPDIRTAQEEKIHQLVMKLLTFFQPGSQNEEIEDEFYNKRMIDWADNALQEGVNASNYVLHPTRNDTNKELYRYATFCARGNKDLISKEFAVPQEDIAELKERNFAYFDQLEDQSERNLALAVCYYAGIGRDQNLQLALEHVEKAQKGFLPKFAALQYVKILEALIVQFPDQRDHYLASLLAVYQNEENGNDPVLIARCALTLQSGFTTPFDYSDSLYRLGMAFLDNPQNEGRISMGIHLLNLAAGRQNPEALFELGKMCESGKYIARSPALAFQHYAEAHDHHHHDATLNLARCFVKGIGTKVDHKYGFNLFTTCLERGQLESLVYLGEAYQYGSGTDIDLKKAYEYYKRAYDNKVPGGLEQYASCFLEGVHARQNIERGIELLEEGIAKNSPLSMYLLAQVLFNSVAKKKNSHLQRIRKLLEDAAKLNQIDALNELGVGHIVKAKYLENESNDATGIEYFKRAAALGSTKSMRALGQYYLAKDSALAVRWYEEGIENGDTLAGFLLANALYNGQGAIGINKPKAVALYAKMAASGSSESISRLIEHYLLIKDQAQALGFLRILEKVPNHSPDTLSELASYYLNPVLGTAVDYEKASDMMAAALSWIRDGNDRSLDVNLASIGRSKKEVDKLIVDYGIAKYALQAELQSFKALHTESINKKIEELKEKKTQEIRRIDEVDERTELESALESYFQEVVELYADSEKQRTKVVGECQKRYDELSVSSLRVNLDNMKKIETATKHISLGSKILGAAFGKKELDQIGKGWNEKKEEISQKYEKTRERDRMRNEFSEYKGSLERQIAQKIDATRAELKRRNQNIEQMQLRSTQFFERSSAAGQGLIEEGQPIDQVNKEMATMTSQVIQSLTATFNPVVISPISQAKDDTDLLSTIKDLRKDNHKLMSEFESATLKHEIEKQKIRDENELKLSQEREKNRRLKEELDSLHLKTLNDQISGDISTLKDSIGERLDLLEDKGRDKLSKLAFKDIRKWIMGKIREDSLEKILLGLGYTKPGSSGSSHVKYTSPTGSSDPSDFILLTGHGNNPAGKNAEIASVLNLLLSRLNNLS